MSLYSQNEKVEKVDVAKEMSQSFLDYSMSVIISRALPDARDGLKPSQRRILYAMHELGALPAALAHEVRQDLRRYLGQLPPARRGRPSTPPSSTWPSTGPCARPSSIRRATSAPWKATRRPPCVTPRRRFTHLGGTLLDDLDKDTVDFVPNYDERLTEPTVFPAAFPNLLVNGGTGIAVGMATNMPPHNLSEIIDGICAQIDDPDITIDGLMEHVKGPDFPTGCVIQGSAGIKQYFHTGRGAVRVRGRAGIEEVKGGREQIIITEIPLQCEPGRTRQAHRRAGE